jgi:hypothetical protein
VRVLRLLRRAVVYESREGRAAEIAGWSNFVAAFVVGAGAFYAERSFAFAFAALVAALVALRLALANRVTVWLAAAVGSLSVATACGALAWTFAHVLEMPAAPPIAGALGALVGGAIPATAYLRIARRRADDVPDSLLHAPSLIPPSA